MQPKHQNNISLQFIIQKSLFLSICCLTASLLNFEPFCLIAASFCHILLHLVYFLFYLFVNPAPQRPNCSLQIIWNNGVCVSLSEVCTLAPTPLVKEDPGPIPLDRGSWYSPESPPFSGRCLQRGESVTCPAASSIWCGCSLCLSHSSWAWRVDGRWRGGQAKGHTAAAEDSFRAARREGIKGWREGKYWLLKWGRHILKIFITSCRFLLVRSMRSFTESIRI